MSVIYLILLGVLITCLLMLPLLYDDENDDPKHAHSNHVRWRITGDGGYEPKGPGRYLFGLPPADGDGFTVHFEVIFGFVMTGMFLHHTIGVLWLWFG